MQSNEDEKDTVSESPLSRDDLIYKLISIGVNSSQSSYGNENKELYVAFLELPLVDVAPLWPYLSERVQIDVIKNNHEEFMKWINSYNSTGTSHRIPSLSVAG